MLVIFIYLHVGYDSPIFWCLLYLVNKTHPYIHLLITKTERKLHVMKRTQLPSDKKMEKLFFLTSQIHNVKNILVLSTKDFMHKKVLWNEGPTSYNELVEGTHRYQAY